MIQEKSFVYLRNQSRVKFLFWNSGIDEHKLVKINNDKALGVIRKY